MIAFGRWSEAVDDFVVYLMDADGNGQRQLLPGPHEGPRWSPDGTRISITAIANDRVFPAVINPDGTGYKELPVPDPTLNLGCWAWSPDGQRLVCEGWDDPDTGRRGVYTVRAADGGDVQRVTSSPKGYIDIPTAYSPDGKQIAFMRGREGESLTAMLVTVGNEPELLGDGNLADPVWSPDGRFIVSAWHDHLYLLPAAGGERTQITIVAPSPLGFFQPRWSPDGEWLVAGGVRPDSGEDADIYRMRADGTELTLIADDPAQEEFADWSPVQPPS